MRKLDVVAYRGFQFRVTRTESVPVNEPYKRVETLVAGTIHSSAKVGAEVVFVIGLVLEVGCREQLRITSVKVIACCFLEPVGVGIFYPQAKLSIDLFG